MIYCGYQGSGKSTYCRKHPNSTIDLDSSNFAKVQGWEKEYIKIALNYSSQGKKVFISAHQNVIECLMAQNIKFVVMAPKDDKSTWEARLRFRYGMNPNLPNLKALSDCIHNFDKDMKYYQELEKRGVQVFRITAKIITNIDELLQD